MLNKIFVIFSLLLCVTHTHSAVDADLIDEFDLVRTNVKLSRDDWDVNTSELDKDPFTFKGQSRDLTEWGSVDPIAWFDLNTWKKQRAIKDSDNNWKQKFREVNHYEKIGKVIKCIGSCKLFRFSKANHIEYNSNIFEGDEVLTGKDSAMWILLVDGSIVRMSSETSFTALEFNISKKETFLISRLNYGYIHYESRQDGKFKELNRPESDLAFLPLMLKEANREYYMIQEYRGMDRIDQLAYSVVENPGYVLQYKALNELINENSEFMGKMKNNFFIYTPNMTLQGEKAALNIFYEVNGKSLVFATDEIENFELKDIKKSKIQVTLRGYKDFIQKELVFNQWLEVDIKGKTIAVSDQNVNVLDASKNFTKRIPSIYLARELWLKEKFKEVYETDKTFKKYAQESGYRLWDELKPDEMKQRGKYLFEYTRRVETSNLDLIDKVFEPKRELEIEIDQIQFVMNKHYTALRRRFSIKNKMVREMSDTQYGLWVLRYAR